jgi:phosphatidylserine/phosphatidylglycerophosphate/cardiolipin synthase-like enzyme
MQWPPDAWTLMWIQIATGFTGALTLMHFIRVWLRKLGWVLDVKVYFSPKGGCQEAVLKEIKIARREILVQAYSFTSEPITMALVEAKKRGVQVEVLLDHSNEKERYSDLHVFMEQGLDPHVDHDHAIAHNKIMLIDKRTIITGSYNFTNQAEHENAENLLIIKGHPDLPGIYRANFLQHKSHCKRAEIKPGEQKDQRRPHTAPATIQMPTAAPQKAAA